MKALVTGATGFIGLHLVNQLIKDGHDVTVLVRKPLKDTELKGLPVRAAIGDVTDFHSLLHATENQDIVYHLAGKIAYKPAERKEMEKVNVGGTQKVVDACVTQKTPALVYMSSVVAIGAGFTPQALTEVAPYNIKHLQLGYFDTKHAAEELVRTAVQHNGLNAYILNPSTVYGAGDAAKGSRSVQRKVASGSFPFYTPGGVNVVHINDVLYCLKTITQKGRVGERYIVAGENLLLKDVFRMIAEVAGVKPPRMLLPRWALHTLGALGDNVLAPLGLKSPLSRETAWTSSMYHWFSSQKAQKELGLKVTPAKLAIQDSVEWMINNGYLS